MSDPMMQSTGHDSPAGTLFAEPFTRDDIEVQKPHIERAESGADPAWLAKARSVIKTLADTGYEFTTDDVLAQLPLTSCDTRALGGPMRAAALAGQIRDTGRVRPSRRREANHGRKVTIWIGSSNE